VALQKQPISINFALGVDTKSDPFQLPAGNFITLVNSQFGVTGRLTKRNGYDNITDLPNSDQTILTSLKDNLIATGSDLYTYSPDTQAWYNRGSIQPVQLEAVSLVRNSASQVSPYIVVNTNGLACLTYTASSTAYYMVVDTVTGQEIVPQTALPSTATNPKAFILGQYFIITFVATVLATPTLQFIALHLNSPTTASSAMTISADVNSLTAGYDAVATSNRLFIAWGASANSVKIVYVNRSLGLATEAVLAGITADNLSIANDSDNSRIYVSYWETSGNTGFSASFNYNLQPLMTATQIINSIEIRELSSIVVDGDLKVYYETINTYTYGTALTDYVSKLVVTPPLTTGAGSVGSASVVLRSVGLASTPFIATDGTIYMMVAYGEPSQSSSLDDSNQPTYFLIDDSGTIYGKLAYSNGGGYANSNVLPAIQFVNDTYYFPYEIVDFLTSVNKNTGVSSSTPVNAIFTQTGINLAKFQLNIGNQYASEIAGALHLTGGQLWEFDGVKPVEHGFHLWPENIGGAGTSNSGSSIAQIYYYVFTYEWTDNQGNIHRSAPSIPFKLEILTPPANFTANTTSGNHTLTNVSSFTGLQVGQILSGTGITAGSYIVSMNTGASTIIMSANASATNTGVTITPTRVSSTDLYVPTLRVTNKSSTNPVRIVGYRWSTAQQIYYQFTSVTAPVLNNTAVDYVTISDGRSDAQILGNPILYTVGGVLENIGAPACTDSTLFDNRVWLIDAEDQNLLWYSKQVIQNVPVEFSDLLTKYIAPTTGAQGSTGPMRCIAPMDDKIIIFKDNALYYISGTGPNNLGTDNGYSEPIYVTGVVGSSNPNSIVLTPMGLMFQSNKGIWLLARDLSTKYIGAAVEAYNQYDVLSAEVIPNTNQVRFVLENSVTLMYDYYYDQWGVHTNIGAISAVVYQGLHTYLNQNGKVFQQSLTSYKDGSTPVLMSLTTAWINIAGVQGFERFYFANLLGTYYSPFKLQVQFAYDYNSSPQQSVIVTQDNSSPNWGGEALWGSGGPWGGSEDGNVFTARIFPEKQKCQSFQVTIQEIYDPSFGLEAGQGLSLSGLLLTAGMKKGFRTQSARRSFG
jgi:hypothetical protein